MYARAQNRCYPYMGRGGDLCALASGYVRQQCCRLETPGPRPDHPVPCRGRAPCQGRAQSSTRAVKHAPIGAGGGRSSPSPIHNKRTAAHVALSPLICTHLPACVRTFTSGLEGAGYEASKVVLGSGSDEKGRRGGRLGQDGRPPLNFSACDWRLDDGTNHLAARGCKWSIPLGWVRHLRGVVDSKGVRKKKPGRRGRRRE